MWHRLVPLRRARLIVIVGVVAAISGLALADRYLGDRAPGAGGHGIARRSKPCARASLTWTRDDSGTRSGPYP